MGSVKIYRVNGKTVPPSSLEKHGVFWVKLDTPEGYPSAYRSVATGKVIRWASWRLEEVNEDADL